MRMCQEVILSVMSFPLLFLANNVLCHVDFLYSSKTISSSKLHRLMLASLGVSYAISVWFARQ